MSEHKYSPVPATSSKSEIPVTSYEANRLRLKNNTVMTIFFLLKSTTGIGFFTIQYGIVKCGFILGFLQNCLLCYLTTWGLVVMCDLANKVENSNLEEFEPVSSYQSTFLLISNNSDLIKRCDTKCGKYIVPVVIIATIGIIQGSTISNIILIVTRLATSCDVPEWQIKLPIFLIITVMIITIQEPERFAVIGIVMTIVLLAMCFCFIGENFTMAANQFENVPLGYFDLQGLVVYVGLCGYIYESASSFINIRRCMESPKKLGCITIWTFSAICMFLYQIGISFLVAYGKYVAPKTAFDYYTGKFTIFSTFIYFYAFTNIFTFLFNTSCTQEIQEDTPMKCLLLNKNNDSSIFKIILFRLFIWTGGFALTMCTDNVHVIQNFAGCFFSPILSFMVPVIIQIEYNLKNQIKIKWYEWIHHVLILLLSMFSMGCGVMMFYNTMRSPAQSIFFEKN